MIEILSFAAIAIAVGFAARVVYCFIEFLFKLRSSGWDVDELERRLDVEEAATLSGEIAPTITVIELEAEAHGNTVYCFEVKSRRFVCQGTSVDELDQNLKSKYSNKDVVGRIISSTQEARALLIAGGVTLYKKK